MPHESELINAHLPCPHCGSHDALAEYTDGHTYCFSCQHETQPKKRKQPPKNSREAKGETTVTLPLIKDLTEYPTMTKRKLTEDTLRKFGYKCQTRQNKIWHAAPYYDKEGNLQAQHLRGPDKAFKWTGSTEKLRLFGQQLWGGAGAKRVVVTEGELDCMTVSQIQENKWPVVSIPSGVTSAAQSFRDNLEWLESYETVVICFDNDDPGKKAARECAQILSPGKATIAHLPLKDPSDMYVAGRGKELINCLWNAEAYRPEGILSGTTLWEELAKEPESGLMTPFEELNKATRGIRKGELWLFTAGSGIGKSTIVHEIAYKFLMQDNVKLGIMALEESKRRAAERYLSIYLDHPLHLDHDGVTEAKLKEAFDKTIGRTPCAFELYDHFGSTDTESLLSKMRYMFVGLGVDIIILDHITIAVSGRDGDEISEGDRKALDVLMTKLRSLVAETGKTVLAVAHLRRPEKGKSWNEGREPRLTDLRGSAALEQLSDVVVALYRDQTDPERANIGGLLVLKNRPVGITGAAGFARYEQETGRLLPMKEAEQYFKAPPEIEAQTPEDAEKDF